jgi:hypothetical protein
MDIHHFNPPKLPLTPAQNSSRCPQGTVKLDAIIEQRSLLPQQDALELLQLTAARTGRNPSETLGIAILGFDNGAFQESMPVLQASREFSLFAFLIQRIFHTLDRLQTGLRI